MNADGSGQRRLVREAWNKFRRGQPWVVDTVIGQPRWSPDGRKLVFVSRRDGNREVYVINADGSAQRNLTRNPVADSDPAWSPDGRKIAFFSTRDGETAIYVMNADGSGQRSITRGIHRIGAAFAWSPAQR